jgi:hypothetical protein
LKKGEFKLCLAQGENGAIWDKMMFPEELKPQFTFVPVVDFDGNEHLGLFLLGKNGLLPMALMEPDCAAELVNDLMVSTAQYSDPTLLAEVSKRVQDVVLAYDLPIKKQLLTNSTDALEQAMDTSVEKRVKAKTKHFESTIDGIEARAELKMAKIFANKLAELASIAVTPDAMERKMKIDQVMPEIKRILEITTK